MATLTFDSVSKEKKGVAPDPEPEHTLATQPAKGLISFDGGGDDMSGEFSTRHLNLPFVSIVQKTTDSSLIKAFGLGTTIYNKEVMLAGEDGAWEMTPLRLQLAFVQNVPFGTEGNTFFTSEEARAAGGTFAFDKNNAADPNRYDEQLFLTAAIVKPADCPEDFESMFPFEFGDKAWAMGAMRLKGGSYFGLGKLLITHRRSLLSEGLAFGRYEIGVQAKSNAKGEWHIFTGKFVGKNDADTATFLKGAA